MAVGASGVIGAVATWVGVRPTTSAPVRAARFPVSSGVFAGPSGRAVAVSPDGERWMYTTRLGLAVRPRRALEDRHIPGVSGSAGAPFFSPDGQWIGFTEGTTLKRVSISGGTPQILAHVAPAATGSWHGADIAFADMRGVFVMRAEPGAPPRLVAELPAHEQAVHPQLLPGGRAILFAVIQARTNTPGFPRNRPGIRLEVLNLQTGERRTLLHGAGKAQYLRTGHLIYGAGDALHIAPFDLDRLAVRGDPVRVDNAGLIDFSVSDEGTMVAVSRRGGENVLVWVDREGLEAPLDAEPKLYVYPRLSPDGARIALDVAGPSRDIWIWNIRRGVLTNFTNDSAGNALSAWSPDGQWLLFGSDRFGVPNMFRQRSDGAGDAERLIDSARTQHVLGFAPDGRLLFSVDVEGHGRDVHALSMDTGVVTPILEAPWNCATAEVSPDGRWLTYDADESGRFDVYVAPYPDAYTHGHVQISTHGGRQPLWSRDGRELFYRDLTGAMMAVPVTFTPTFEAGRAVTLFENAGYAGAGDFLSGRAYDVAGDGRFLMIKETASYELDVTVGWFDELRRLLPR